MANTHSNVLIIIAHSARALSESASRAGYDVIAVDGFSDVDTLQVCKESWCLPLLNGEFVSSKLQTCLQRLHLRYPQAKVLLGAGAESLTDSVENYEGWYMCANSSEISHCINTPQIFFQGLDDLNIPYPDTKLTRLASSGEWIFKQAGTCGGVGISRDAPASDLRDEGYWQREIVGQSVSALCISDNSSVTVIGFNQQMLESRFDAFPFLYKGVIANFDIQEKYNEIIKTYIDKLKNHFNLVGVFSVDMIISQDVIYVLEVNSRISASYELYEQINPDLNLVDAHIRVCEGERLSKIELENSQCGYFIVYANQDYVIPSGVHWPKWVKDRPESLRSISLYEPICSVHACGVGIEGVEAQLFNQEREILNLLNQSDTNKT